jgi:hypothetical protein
MKTQIPELFVEEANKSGLEPAKAELYAASFAPYMKEVVDLIQEAKKVNKANPTEKDSAQARKIRLALVKPRKDAERKKDEQKASLLKETNLIQSLYNTVKSTAELTEAEMLEVEKHQERLEAERKAVLKAEREELLLPYCDPSMFPLADMAQDAFEHLLNGQKLAHEARIEAERKAEEQRIEVARLEAERIEKQRLENERLKKEAEAREAQLEKERKEAAAKQKSLEEAARKEREEAQRIQREADEKARKEREQLQAKLDAERKAAEAAKAELDRKEREAKAEAERIERERIAAEKKAAAAPDKVKLAELKKIISEIQVPTFKTQEAQQIGNGVKALLIKVEAYIEERSSSI